MGSGNSSAAAAVAAAAAAAAAPGGRGENFGKLKIEIGGSGWRGWIDLGEAVWKAGLKLKNEFRRNSKRRF